MSGVTEGGARVTGIWGDGTRSVLDLARAHDVYVPITEAVVQVCHEGQSAAGMVKAMMTREAKPE